MVHSVSLTLNGAELSIETGRFAKLADGAVMIRHGETMVLVTAVAASQPASVDFLPLTVEYREKTASAGKIPGGFFKREARPTEKEILSARLIDRPCRPMFPKGWNYETQIIATVFSFDKEYEPDTIAVVAASAALMISSIPFDGPIAEVRVGRIGGEFVVNPTITQLQECDMELVIAGTDDSVVMVEGSADEISEEDFIAAMEFGHEWIKKLNQLQRDLAALFSREKRAFTKADHMAELVAFLDENFCATIKEQVRDSSSKEIRSERRKELGTAAVAAAIEAFPAETYPDLAHDKAVNEIISKIEKREMREMILAENKRLDGRTCTDIRPIDVEVGVLPRTHGSALFTRGETQALGTVTLGTKLDEQMIDGLMPTFMKRFMLHYNFPPFSTNEVKRMMSTSRREIGHGHLAEVAIERVLPGDEEFAYTVRIVSDVLMSNGSSSMATVCAASLALFDAGVPIKKAVSGIAMGLIKEGDRVAILSDILGDEDFLGDMDFKVAGTADGITACQMDMKIQGISMDTVRQALAQAREGRYHILDKMNAAIDAPKSDLSQYAPRMTKIKIPTDMIGIVIGPGGETIRRIQTETGTELNIEDDGTVTIAATSGEAAQAAIKYVNDLTRMPEVGTVYNALIKEVREGLGAIVEFLPKKQGLLHISQIAHHRVENASDVLKQGERIDVKLIEIQSDGKFRLSRKALLEPAEGEEVVDDYAPRDRGPRRDDRGPRRDYDRGPRRDDRGPRRDDDRGPRRDYDRGPRRDDDRGPRRDDDRGPRRDYDRAPRRDDDRAPRRDDDREPRRDS